MSAMVRSNAGPHEVFEAMRRGWIAGDATFDDLLTDDAVVETPFAPPGRPNRFAGRAEFVAFAEAAGRTGLPVRFEECREIAVHETADPEVIVVEYELAGTVTTTGRRAAARFVGVLRVRAGRIVAWREYQDTPTMAAALGGLPDLVAAYDDPSS